MECLLGNIVQATDFTEAVAYELGTLLARIHSEKTAYYGDCVQKNEQSVNYNDYFGMKFKESLEECKNNFPAELLEKCWSYYIKNIHLLDIVDGPCMVHRDFRLGNDIKT